MPSATEIATFADALLQSKTVPDYPFAFNGLQVDTPAHVSKIAAAVDFSARTVAETRRRDAQLLVVHHGAFWQGAQPIVGRRYQLLAGVLRDSIGVYSAHLPLDCHESIGNNALLAKRVGLRVAGGFAPVNGIPIGVMGESTDSLESLIATVSAFAAGHGGALRVTTHAANRTVGRWAMCTGSGANSETLTEAVERGVRTLIVGEGPHWTSVFAEDHDIVILYAGHYATETLGVQALAAEIAKQFRIDWEFIAAPTGS